MRSTPWVDGCCGPMFRTIVCAGPVAVSTLWDVTVVVIVSSTLANTWPECRESLGRDSRDAKDVRSNLLAIGYGANRGGRQIECPSNRRARVRASLRRAKRERGNRQKRGRREREYAGGSFLFWESR